MSSTRRFFLSLAVCAAVTGAACGDPPDKEIQQAQGAIDAARAAGADQYARDEFTAADEALKRAHEAVAQRDYRQALNNALDARERAQAAAKETVNRKATARADATKALADADAALHDSRAKLKAAETAHIAARTLANGRKAIDNGESAVQEARTAFEKGDYLGAIQTARSVAGHLGPASRDLDAAAAAGGRRRH
jgi:chromosome segregation ATPase